MDTPTTSAGAGQPPPVVPTAHVAFTAPVTPKSADALLSACTRSLGAGVSRMEILVASPGGSVAAGVALYNLMLSLPMHFTTWNVGNVDSIALLPLLAGEERYSVPGASFLFHGVGFDSPPAGFRMEEKFFREKLDSVRAEHKKLAGIIATRTRLVSEGDIMSLYSSQATKEPEWAKSVGIVHDIRQLRLPAGVQLIQIANAAA